jgi:hypothetical protein
MSQYFDQIIIAKKNIEIAIFMGADTSKSTRHVITDELWDLHIKGVFYTRNELCYHMSWNWLFPVFDKISACKELETDGILQKCKTDLLADFNDGAHIEDIWYGCWKFIGRLDYLKTKEPLEK